MDTNIVVLQNSMKRTRIDSTKTPPTFLSKNRYTEEIDIVNARIDKLGIPKLVFPTYEEYVEYYKSNLDNYV